MAIAIAILATLLSLLLIGGGIGFAIYGVIQQNRIQRAIEDGFREHSQHILNATLALNNEAAKRDGELAEKLNASRRVSVWIPPNDGCEICGNPAIAVCSSGDNKPVWLCGPCHAENEGFG